MADGKTLFRALTNKKETSAQDYSSFVAIPAKEDDDKVQIPIDKIVDEVSDEKSEKSYDPLNPPLRKMANLVSKRASVRHIEEEFAYPQDFTKINEELSYTAKVD